MVRDNTERLRPPRFLWVPFELGRPFGAPGEPAFQTRVLRDVLGLLERDGPPPLLEEFPDDAPSSGTYLTGWTCPIPLPKPTQTDNSLLLVSVLAEINGFEEPLGRNRPRGYSYSTDFSGPNWLDQRNAAIAYSDREPTVIVVGGGQAGL